MHKIRLIESLTSFDVEPAFLFTNKMRFFFSLLVYFLQSFTFITTCYLFCCYAIRNCTSPSYKSYDNCHSDKLFEKKKWFDDEHLNLNLSLRVFLHIIYFAICVEIKNFLLMRSISFLRPNKDFIRMWTLNTYISFEYLKN